MIKQLRIRSKTILLQLITILSFLLILSCSSTESDFIKAKELDTISAYENFLIEHPDSEYDSIVKSILEKLECGRALKLDSISLYKDFIKKYPDSRSIEIIQSNLELCEYNNTELLNTLNAYENFIQNYPNSNLVEKANKRIVLWELWQDLLNNIDGVYSFYSSSSFITGKGKKYPELTTLNLEIQNKAVYGITDLYNLFYDPAEKNHLSFFNFSTFRTYTPRIYIEFHATINDSVIVINKSRLNQKDRFSTKYNGTEILLLNEKLTSSFFTDISQEFSTFIDKSIKESNVSNKINYKNNIDLDFQLTSTTKIHKAKY